MRRSAWIFGTALLLGEPCQARREPPGDVEEVQLLHVVRQPAQLARKLLDKAFAAKG